MATEYNQITTKCANCQTEYTFGSTTDKIDIELCANCHPFYTGKSSLIDTSGRVEKFAARVKAAQADVKKVKKVRTRKARLSITDLNEETSK